MLLMASSCAWSASNISLDVLSSQLNLPLLSWEFFTTLDFEWSIIRGNRPYRWTIWVRADGVSLKFPQTPRADLSPSLDLFPDADSCFDGSDPRHRRT
jgi:hypothetical protein